MTVTLAASQDVITSQPAGYSPAAQAYFASRAIEPSVAGQLGVAERDGALVFTVQGERGAFQRTRSLNGGGPAKVLQPKGQALEPWWPRSRPELARQVLVVEGESDALAAASALAGGPLRSLAELPIAAVPGCGFPVKRLIAELQRVECAFAYIAFDADEAGRKYAAEALRALGEAGIRAAALHLPDGADLAETAAAQPAADRGEWLADLLVDAEATTSVPGPREAAAEPQSIVADGRATPAPSVAAPVVFNAPALAGELAAETPIASGGEQLYAFRDGAYRPDGERDLKRRIAARLGADWTRRKQDEVLGYLYATARPLWERPPLDRVNVANGILELSTGKLEPHDPDFLSPVQIRAAYDPAARCPRFERFLGEVLDPELAPIVYELAGYLVIPDQSLQAAVMLLGSGENGKSTLLSTIVRLLGEHNVSAVPLQRLDESNFATAELYGRLANIVADLDARALRSSSTFKGITGGDLLQAERKFRPAFTFTPYARLIYSANEVPPTPDSSDAFFRRWLILPFERSFKGKADRQLLDKLTTPTELSGLLNRAVAALPELKTRGRFAETETTRQAGERFRVDADSVAGFLDDRATVELEARVAKSELFGAYKSWCGENGRQPLSAVRFNRRVVALIPADRLEERTVQGVRQWVGVSLRGLGL